MCSSHYNKKTKKQCSCLHIVRFLLIIILLQLCLLWSDHAGSGSFASTWHDVFRLRVRNVLRIAFVLAQDSKMKNHWLNTEWLSKAEPDRSNADQNGTFWDCQKETPKKCFDICRETKCDDGRWRTACRAAWAGLVDSVSSNNGGSSGSSWQDAAWMGDKKSQQMRTDHSQQ